MSLCHSVTLLLSYSLTLSSPFSLSPHSPTLLFAHSLNVPFCQSARLLARQSDQLVSLLFSRCLSLSIFHNVCLSACHFVSLQVCLTLFWCLRYFVNLTVCRSIYLCISHFFVFVFRSSSCQTGCACPRARPPSIWLMFTFYILDDELSKSRTEVTGKHSSVKSKMACPTKVVGNQRNCTAENCTCEG